MKLQNRFTVPVPRSEAWQVLLDVERIAPCLPGAKVTSRDGDSFTGQVKVKLGPINLTYGGDARFVQLDEAGGVAVIDASGKETRGTGTAKATITCKLVDQGATTDIEVDTDLAITGKPAQFGRGVLADVSAKLVDQFAACLSEEIRQGASAPAAASPSTGGAEQSDTAGAEATAGPAPTTSFDMALQETLAHAAGDSPSSQDVQVAPAGPGAAAAPLEDPTGATPPADLAHAGAGHGAAAPAPTGGTGATDPAAAAGASASTAPRAHREQADAIDLLDTAGLPVAKRLVPVLAGVVLLVLVVRALRR